MKRNGERRAEPGTALLEAKRPTAPRPEKTLPALPGVSSGILAGIDASGFPLVVLSGTATPLLAKNICPVTGEDTGREAILSFENGDPGKPVILGVVQSPVAPRQMPAEVMLDGERLAFTAKEQIVFRCGKASITLTRAGKVLIRGAYVLSRSSGANRIKGGSVQIN